MIKIFLALYIISYTLYLVYNLVTKKHIKPILYGLGLTTLATAILTTITYLF